MKSTEYWYIVCYDIRSPKRLQKVQRLLRKKAFMLQESVYLFASQAEDLSRLRTELIKYIRIHEDDMRIYQLGTQSCFDFYNHTPWGPHIFLSQLPYFIVTSAINPSSMELN